MAASDRTESKWLAFSLTVAVATISSAVAVSEETRDSMGRRRFESWRKLSSRAWKSVLLRGKVASGPRRNGTPRQPLLVPLARAQLLFYPTHVPPASLEGLEEYSHCWIIYVFHLNTDLEKLWKDPSNSKFKAKVRVPRLKGRRMGVFATRSPHRLCPIGLTVAKVEAIQEHMVLVSGADLVDGTPVLDIKPYLPYSDSIQEATVPAWVKADNLLTVTSVDFSEDFTTALADCWTKLGKKSLYASPR